MFRSLQNSEVLRNNDTIQKVSDGKAKRRTRNYYCLHLLIGAFYQVYSQNTAIVPVTKAPNERPSTTHKTDMPEEESIISI